VISGAPWSFTIAVLLAAGIVWLIIHFLYSTQIANTKGNNRTSASPPKRYLF